MKKLSVALDSDVADAAAAAAERDGLSLSAWLNRAAESALAIHDGLAAVREYEAEHGPIGEDARAWARAVSDELLGDRSRRP